MWPAVTHETLPWRRDPDELALVPKSRRRRILSEYESAVVPPIATCQLDLPHDIWRRIAELETSLVRFDTLMRVREFDLPLLLLRSESSSSSQIERLTSSARNIALAELSGKAPKNAQLIAHNLAAMRTALCLPDDLTVSGMIQIHWVLMGSEADELRDEQVWIGGTPNSPHDASYVPPCADRVWESLDDLCAFASRDDIPAIAKAAIVHAQFESIHPFTDGNGRTGRTLLHKMLLQEGVLAETTLPISTGLLHDIDQYLEALTSYQQGNVFPIISCLADALDVALALGMRAQGELALVLDGWRRVISERAGSAIHQLPDVLVEHPVLNAPLVAETLGITDRAARDLLRRAEQYGIVRRMGTERRGVFYQADDLLDILDDLAADRSAWRTIT